MWQNFHAQNFKRDAEWNEQWLVVWHVGETASWAGLGQRMLPWIPDLQPSVWRSGYARLEDRCSRSFIGYFILLSFTASRYCTVDLRQLCREMALICFESMHNSLCHSSDAFLYFLSVKKVQINSIKCLSKYAIPSLSFLLHDTMYTNQHTYHCKDDYSKMDARKKTPSKFCTLSSLGWICFRSLKLWFHGWNTNQNAWGILVLCCLTNTVSIVDCIHSKAQSNYGGTTEKSIS